MESETIIKALGRVPTAAKVLGLVVVVIYVGGKAYDFLHKKCASFEFLEDVDDGLDTKSCGGSICH